MTNDRRKVDLKQKIVRLRNTRQRHNNDGGGARQINLCRKFPPQNHYAAITVN